MDSLEWPICLSVQYINFIEYDLDDITLVFFLAERTSISYSQPCHRTPPGLAQNCVQDLQATIIWAWMKMGGRDGEAAEELHIKKKRVSGRLHQTFSFVTGLLPSRGFGCKRSATSPDERIVSLLLERKKILLESK